MFRERSVQQEIEICYGYLPCLFSLGNMLIELAQLSLGTVDIIDRDFIIPEKTLIDPSHFLRAIF